MHSLILAAQAFAHAAHRSIDQRRKYAPFPPYEVHTDEVAAIYYNATGDEIGTAVAHLHDVIEDVYPKNPYYNLDLIRAEFGDEVAQGVFDLTDQYTFENYPPPIWNRVKRKTKEAERLGLVSPRSQGVKLADLISNTSDIVVNDPNFARTYLREKKRLLPYLRHGNQGLWMRATELAIDGYAKLGMVW